MVRVLIVETEFGVRESVSEALAIDGHAVVAVVSVTEAVAELRDDAFDVLVVSLESHHLGGAELIAFARATHPGMTLLVSSSRIGPDQERLAMELGALDLLRRPIRLAEIRALVARAEVARRLRTIGSEHDDLTMPELFSRLDRVAATPASVLFLGDAESGKRSFAHILHQRSARAHAPFVHVACGALFDDSLGELFGGDQSDDLGLIDEARGGTLFLENIESFPPGAQARLARVLEGPHDSARGLRVVSSTDHDLRHLVRLKIFRPELYHRLVHVALRVPSLSRRREDVVFLANTLTNGLSESLEMPGLSLSGPATASLARVAWAQDVGSLHDTLERAAIFADGAPIDLDHIARARALIER